MSQEAFSAIQSVLTRFDACTHSATIVYYAPPGGKPLEHSDAAALRRSLYRCSSGRHARINLVLTTEGGQVAAARKIAVMIRSICDTLITYIPERARSAGTILSMASSDIVLAEMAELGPVDPFLRADAKSKAFSQTVSSEEIRCFSQMGKEWFGLTSEASRLELVRMLCDSFAPTTLTSFYRAEQYVRQVLIQLLGFQFIAYTRDQLAKIADGLLTKFPDHFHSLTTSDLCEIGVRVRDCKEPEREFLQELQSLLETLWATRGNSRGYVLSRHSVFSSSLIKEESGSPGGTLVWQEIA